MSTAKRPGSGVIIREAHLQIDLRAQGYGRERLELEPTPSNIRYAERLRSEILGKIERGSFVLADYFPTSPRARKDAASLSFAQVIEEWLAVKAPAIAHSTLHHYRQSLGSYHFDTWRAKRMDQLDYRALMALLAAMPPNGKTFNNLASVLSQVLEYAHRAKLLKEPLHEHIEMRKHQKPGPDPLTLAEVEIVLGKMKNPQARTFYEFAFFSGLRPSEQIALRWAQVDLRAGTVTVDKAHTRSQDKGTKTGQVRTVELTSRARAAIERQRPLTQVAGAHVFLCPDGAACASTDGPLDAWWKPALKVAGIRYRDARQTRHTFATLCLHAGITPAWAAQQLGHSVEMFYRVYSKWIAGADHGAERRRLDAFLSDGTGTQTGT